MFCAPVTSVSSPALDPASRRIEDTADTASFSEELAGFSSARQSAEQTAQREAATSETAVSSSQSTNSKQAAVTPEKQTAGQADDDNSTRPTIRSARKERRPGKDSPASPRRRTPGLVQARVDETGEPPEPLKPDPAQTGADGNSVALPSAEPAWIPGAADSADPPADKDQATPQLAFAARLSDGAPAAEAPDPASQVQNVAAASLEDSGLAGEFADSRPVPQKEKQTDKGADTEGTPNPGSLFGTAPVERHSSPQEPVKTNQAAANPAPGVAEPDSRPTPHSDSVRDLSLNLGDTGQPKVEVRLMERAGEVHVAVHADDPDLRRGLREGLSDLVGRLDGSGFKTETWRPPEASFDRQNSSSHQQSPGGERGHQQQGRGRHPDSQPEPEWLDEMKKGFRTITSDPQRRTS